jgi:hypothetical protein
MERIPEGSPRPRARITGVVYLLYFLTAVLGEFFIRGLVVSGDAAATATAVALGRFDQCSGCSATGSSGPWISKILNVIRKEAS